MPGYSNLFNTRNITQFTDVGFTFGAISGGAISRGNLVILTTNTANVPTFIRASSAAVATARGLIAISLCDAAGAGEQIEVTEYYVMRDVNTAAYALQGYAYLAPAGAVLNTAGATSVRVGICIKVHATEGIIVLNPTNVTAIGAGLGNTGTDNDSWTTNLDAAAGTPENPSLILLGGDGGVDLVRTDLSQNSVAETLTYSQRRTGVYVNPTLNIGRMTETTASITSTLNLYGTTAGSVVRSGALSCSGAVIGLVGNNVVAPATASNSLVIATGNTTATLGANFASGGLTILTGDTTQNGAFNNAVSGNWAGGTGSTTQGAAGGAAFASGNADLRSGNTSNAGGGAAASSGTVRVYSGTVTNSAGGACAASGIVSVYSGDVDNTAAGAAANTGAVNVYSGNAISTGAGVASGSSGIVSIYSGGSADANTGNVNVYSGSPTTGTATSGTVAIYTGNLTGAGVSGSITMTPGTTAGGTRGNVSVPADNVSFRVGTTQMVEMRCNTGATTLHVDAIDPANDVASYHVLMESGATVSAAAAANSGNITLRSGTSTSAWAGVGGTTGAWVGGSGDSSVSVAQTGGVTGGVSLYSGDTTVTAAAGGGTSGASGAWTGGSGDCLVAGLLNVGGASGLVTLESGTTDILTAAVGANSGAVTLRSGATDVKTALGGGTGGLSGNLVMKSGDTNATVAAANLGGNSGTVLLQSGDCLSGGAGAVSGISGTVTIRSGNSADCSTGDVALRSGTAVSLAGARVSGNLTIASGTSNTGGNNGGISGNVTVESGQTDCGSAHQAGDSGAMVFRSGACISTTGALSGNTGTVGVYSGASTDANTGTVSFYSGNAAAAGGGITSGGVNINSGTVGGTGTTGTVALASGAATGAGTSGNITFTIGATAAGTAGTIQSIGRHTTTDGVAAGTARIIGGQVMNTVAESAAVANVKTVFAGGTRTIPANTMKVGTNISFEAMIGITAVSGGGCTAQIEVFLGGTGGTLIFDTGAAAAGTGCVANGIFVLRGSLSVRTAGGPAGTMTGFMSWTVGAVTGAIAMGHDVAGSAAGTYTVAVADTTAANTIDIAGTTDAAGTTLRLENFRVWETA